MLSFPSRQACEIEDARLLRYGRLKAMVAIVLATAYFAMAWLGLGDKLAVLADHVKRVSTGLSPFFIRGRDTTRYNRKRARILAAVCGFAVAP